MPNRIVNFNAGPAALPLPVLEKMQAELVEYRGTGMSLLEMSHRSPEFDEVIEAAQARLKELMGLDDRFHVLFLGGGASTQNAMLALNLLRPGLTGAYVDTGSWSTRSIKDGGRVGVGEVDVIASSEDREYTYIPEVPTASLGASTAYLHVTSNNTIRGTQYHAFPDTGDVPLLCDMSSDMCSRVLDYTKFSMIYAGAQKNLGPAGVTVVVIRDDLLQRCREDIPVIWSYKNHVAKNSMFNTPPTFPVYAVRLVLDWIHESGGLEAMERHNREKKDVLYTAMDAAGDFYRGTAEPDSRSWMNVTMRLPTEELEKTFIAEAKAQGLGGLKGHRSVGGVRASLYNAMTMDGVRKLVSFMEAFKASNG